MVCKECGTRIEDGSMFCTSCGATMKIQHRPKTRKEAIKAGQVRSYGRPPVPPITLTSKLVSTFVLVIVFLLVILVSTTIVNSKFSAGKIAETYFVKLVNGEYKSAFKLLDVEEDKFVNKDTFVTFASQMNFENVTEYLIDNPEDSDAASGTISILYNIQGQKEQFRYSVNMIKSEDKKMLFFDDWKVSKGYMVCSNCEFLVIDGAKIVLDGIELDDKYLSEEEYDEEQYDLYCIPQLFTGNHTVEISVEGMETNRRNIYIDSSGMSFSLTEMYCTEEAAKDLQILAVNNMYRIYDAAVKGKSFDEIASIFVSDEESLYYIADEYNYLVQNLHESVQVKNVSFSNIITTGNTGSTNVEVSFEYVLDCMVEDWWTEQLVPDQIQNSEISTFSFEKENGEWKQCGLSCDYLY